MPKFAGLVSSLLCGSGDVIQLEMLLKPTDTLERSSNSASRNAKHFFV